MYIVHYFVHRIFLFFTVSQLYIFQKVKDSIFFVVGNNAAFINWVLYILWEGVTQLFFKKKFLKVELLGQKVCPCLWFSVPIATLPSRKTTWAYILISTGPLFSLLLPKRYDLPCEYVRPVDGKLYLDL